MPLRMVKSPEQIRTETFINNFGNMLLRLSLLLLKIAIFFVTIFAEFLYLPTISAVLWAWLCSTNFAAKTWSTWKLVSHSVSPQVALLVVSTLCSLPIFIRATLEQNGPELEPLLMQITTLAKQYQLSPTFMVGVLGILLTYLVFQLLPGYNDTCFCLDRKLHAPKSIFGLLECRSIPGEFPIVASWRMIDEFDDLLSTKDEEIARLRKGLDQKDKELADLLPQKDEEISDYQTALQLRDKKIVDLQDVKMDSGRQATSEITPNPPFVSSIPSQRAKELQERLKVALGCQRDLQQKLASCTQEKDALKRDVSELRDVRHNKVNRTTRAFVQPQSSFFRECREQVVALETRLLQQTAEAAHVQQATTIRHHQQVSDLEAQLSTCALDGANSRQTLIAQHDQQVKDLKAQLAQRNLNDANAFANTTQYKQQIRDLQAQLSQHDLDIANVRQSFTTQHGQQVRDLQAQLSQRDLDDSDASGNATQCNQQVIDLRALLSQNNINFANEQEKNAALEQQLKEDRSALADMTRNFQARSDRLMYLESQCVKADQLYAEHMNLLTAYRHLKQEAEGSSRASTQHASAPQGQVNSSEAELRTIRQQNAELSNANEQLKRTLKDPRKINPLCDIALAEKDKELAKTREIIRILEENLHAIRVAGGPSSTFLQGHDLLQRDRNALRDKVRKLEGKFYAMEIRASQLQARERTLTLQIERFKGYGQCATRLANSPSTVSRSSRSQEQDVEMTALKNIQQERDNAVRRYEELVTKSQEILEAALENVDWQLDGKSEPETDEKCRALDEDLGMRLKPLLEKIRWQLETAERRYKSLEGQMASQKALEQVKTDKIAALEALVPPDVSSAGRADSPGKRRVEDGEERDEMEGMARKRQHYE